MKDSFDFIGWAKGSKPLMYLAGSYTDFVQEGTWSLVQYQLFHKPQSTEEMLEFKSGKVKKSSSFSQMAWYLTVYLKIMFFSDSGKSVIKL